jgi:AraC-like DNA-binding protein
MANRLSIDNICRLIYSSLPAGYPVIEQVAELLCISTRTLQRRLRDEGVNYTELVERCRCQAASDSLRHSLDPVRVIACNLGYRDTSSFSRAFRRWTGMSPHAYRNHWLGRSPSAPVEMSGIPGRRGGLA